MCCQSQPPQPFATYGQGSSTRNPEDSFRVSIRAKRVLPFRYVSAANAFSPGSSFSTKNISPLESLARHSPDATSFIRLIGLNGFGLFLTAKISLGWLEGPSIVIVMTGGPSIVMTGEAGWVANLF